MLQLPAPQPFSHGLSKAQTLNFSKPKGLDFSKPKTLDFSKSKTLGFSKPKFQKKQAIYKRSPSYSGWEPSCPGMSMFMHQGYSTISLNPSEHSFFSATAYSCPVTSVLEVWLPWATVGKQQMVVIWMKIDVIFYT